MSVSISVSRVVFPELSLTSHNLSTVLDSMDDDLWEDFSDDVNIPWSEVERMKSKYSSAQECKQAAIDYLISSHPAPSWRLLARALYHMVTYVLDDSPHRALARLQQLFPTGTCCSFCTCLHLEGTLSSSCTPVYTWRGPLSHLAGFTQERLQFRQVYS